MGNKSWLIQTGEETQTQIEHEGNDTIIEVSTTRKTLQWLTRNEIIQYFG